MKKVPTREYKGYIFGFSRRRYGNTTFTWLHIKQPDGEFKAIECDPVAKIMPSKADLDNAIAHI